MVCLACLLPIFLIPVVNALPILFYFIMGKIYGVLGWEYRRPERAPQACPFNPSAKKDTNKPGEGVDPVHAEPISKPDGAVNTKED